MKSKCVLVLVSPASQARLNGIARYARERSWMLMIESELSHPPSGWRGAGAIVTVKKDASRLNAFAHELRSAGVPVVNVTGQAPSDEFPTVCGDDEKIGALASDHFADRRFRSVAWFSSKWGRVQQLRCEAFARAWREAVPDAPPPQRLVWSESASAASRADWSGLSGWLGARIGESRKPLGIFAYSDYDASRVVAICQERGIDMPGEVAVLGVDNNPVICENQVVPISSVNHDLERIGYEGAALLDRLMSGDAPPEGPILVEPRGVTVRRSTETVAVSHPVLREAMSFIAAHLSEPIGAPQIADGIGCPRLRLDRLFAKELGISAGHEIARQRLVQAKLLLANTCATLTEIARRTGYCNAAYLANVFRRETGLTPGAWRESNAGAGADAP
ncbi:MAG: substrate-binding domain-containing protein [Kiritimatiellae bacterium]|nr:substrate-binding domain-containing protein [Kiritimatiellia bacterium]